jgi:hypothetical protein
MTTNTLKYFLQAFGLSQAAFARLIGVTPRSVMLWLSGKYEIPGPVDAYVRLLTAATEDVRLSELQRTTGTKNVMRDGLYSVFFDSTTLAGTGFGIGALVFDGGKAYGGDPSGGKYNGDYVYDDATGIAKVRLKITFPPNSAAVFGESYPVEWSVDVTAEVDPRLDAGNTSFVTPHGQKVNVQYKYLHGLPDA